MLYATIGYVSLVDQEILRCTGLLLHRLLCQSGDGVWMQLFDNIVENTTSICRAVGSFSHRHITSRSPVINLSAYGICIQRTVSMVVMIPSMPVGAPWL